MFRHIISLVIFILLAGYLLAGQSSDAFAAGKSAFAAVSKIQPSFNLQKNRLSQKEISNETEKNPDNSSIDRITADFNFNCPAEIEKTDLTAAAAAHSLGFYFRHPGRAPLPPLPPPPLKTKESKEDMRVQNNLQALSPVFIFSAPRFNPLVKDKTASRQIIYIRPLKETFYI